MVVWSWEGDPDTKGKETWNVYTDTLNQKFEKAFKKGQKKVKIDSERFLDLKNMSQRRYDDPNKRRRVKREDKQEQKESEEEESIKWYWAADGNNSQDTWTEFEEDISAKLEKAFHSKSSKSVKIDKERYVDLSDSNSMFQARYDDTAKQRHVKREVVKATKRKQSSSTKSSISKKQKTSDSVATGTSSSHWEVQDLKAPSDVNFQHQKERELYQKYLQTQESGKGICNNLIHGPNAPPICNKSGWTWGTPNVLGVEGWNVWKCIRCGTVNTYPTDNCPNSCSWIEWGWICVDHNHTK